MTSFPRRFAVLPLLLAGAFACASTPESEGDESSALGEDAPPTLDVGELVRGLAAAPASAERKSAGALLERIVDVVGRQIPRAREAERADDQEFTKRLVGYSAEYLKSGEPCEARQKIRLYRGIGSGAQPVLRATAGERKAGVHVAKPMMDAMRRLGLPTPARDAVGMNALNGVDLYEALVTNRRELSMRIDSDPIAAKALTDRIARTSEETNVFSAGNDETLSAEARARATQALTDLKDSIAKADFGFSYQFGFLRDFMDFDSGERREVGLEWTAIALDHTQGAPWGTGAGSPFSPLISTSVNAIEKWGPTFIVADVCPERAVFATSHVDLSEQEVYLPLFVLPEEIVTITTTPAELAAVAQPPAAERPLDAAYRACFSQENATADDGLKAYRAAVKKGLRLGELRAELSRSIIAACSAPAACKPGCVASNYCKGNVSRDPIKSALAKYVNGAPCVVSGPGCKVDGC